MSTHSPSKHPKNNKQGAAVPLPRPLVQWLGAILWPSFLLAGIGTSIFYAYFDPLDLAHLLRSGWEPERAGLYAVGFFCLWLLTAVSSALTWLLLRPPARFNRAPHNLE